jgi:CheY-like chemotaxis protein
LKDVEFTPGPRTQSDQLRELIFAIRTRLDATATQLNQLHVSLEGSGENAAQTLIDGLFGELRSLEKEAHRVLEDSGVAVNATPQALVVEDSAAERKLLEAYLEMSGFDVTTAEDGRDALDYLSMHARPDVVLLDMMMPRVDGPEFVRQVRSDPKMKGLSIFALTAMSPDEVDLPTGPGGVDHWYCKPVNPRALVHDVAEHLTSLVSVA